MNTAYSMRALMHWIALATSLVACTSIAVADVNDQKVPCTADNSESASKALADARAGINKAISSFQTPSTDDVNRQIKWFGPLDNDSSQKVQAVFQKALGLASFAKFWCPNANDLTFKWDVGDVAAVHPTAPGQIFLTPTFFQEGTSGADSELGTFVHELTHLVGVGLKPEVYGAAKAKALGAANPAKARNNSDNYEYYVEDLLYGIP